jgi:hypothetical protein
MNIEQELQRSLRRKQAPPDFADRVLSRIDPTPAASGAAPSRVRHWLAAAAAVTLIATGAARYYEQQQAAAAAARVHQDIGLALRITSEKLALVQARVDASLSDAQR